MMLSSAARSLDRQSARRVPDRHNGENKNVLGNLSVPIALISIQHCIPSPRTFTLKDKVFSISGEDDWKVFDQQGGLAFSFGALSSPGETKMYGATARNKMKGLPTTRMTPILSIKKCWNSSPFKRKYQVDACANSGSGESINAGDRTLRVSGSTRFGDTRYVVKVPGVRRHSMHLNIEGSWHERDLRIWMFQCSPEGPIISALGPPIMVTRVQASTASAAASPSSNGSSSSASKPGRSSGDATSSCHVTIAAGFDIAAALALVFVINMAEGGHGAQ